MSEFEKKTSLFNFRNAILALGHIAVALQRADGEDNTKAVLKFLLQWFDSNSASSSSAFSGGDHAFAFDQGPNSIENILTLSWLEKQHESLF